MAGFKAGSLFDTDFAGSMADAPPDSKLINKKFTRRLLHRNCCLPCMSLFPNPLWPQRRRCRRHIRYCSSLPPACQSYSINGPPYRQ